MEKLDDLYQWLSGEGVYLFDRQLPFSSESSKAVTIKLPATETTGIFIDHERMNNSADEYCTALHESGHYATGTTHKLSSPYDLVEQHEKKADKWAVQHAVRPEELDEAVADGYTDIWSLAEYFGVTPTFMRKAVCWYLYGNLNPDYYGL